MIGLEGYGLKIVERVKIEMAASDANSRYLQTKKDKMGHLLEQKVRVLGHDHSPLANRISELHFVRRSVVIVTSTP